MDANDLGNICIMIFIFAFARNAENVKSFMLKKILKLHSGEKAVACIN